MDWDISDNEEKYILLNSVGFFSREITGDTLSEVPKAFMYHSS